MSRRVDMNKVEELLTRGVTHVYPTNQFLKKRLLSGERLTVYLGIDPTAPTLHIGHVIPLSKLAQFQELGHQVILLIGDFTGMVGDPTDKLAARKPLTREQVLANAATYKKQASAIISFEGKNAAQIRYNSEWNDPLTFHQLLSIASCLTVQQLLERDMFQKRMQEGKAVGLHEFLYPLMQGYDSVAMQVDGEVGGNDQVFNMLVGRDLMKSLSHTEKFVLGTELLVDPSGKKMGKSEGNMVTLADVPHEMFGKVMSWTDEMIMKGFELCTIVPRAEIVDMKKDLECGANPRDYKLRLAREMVTRFYSPNDAEQAQEQFLKLFQKHEQPETMPTYSAKRRSATVAELLVESGLATSKGEARRVIEQKGVKVDDHIVQSIEEEIVLSKKGVVLQKGKRHFVRVTI